jgi:hypothetical protein
VSFTLELHCSYFDIVGMVHACVGQKVMPINLKVRQNQPLKVKTSAQKAQMTKQTPSPW